VSYWKNIPEELPADAAIVWVRLNIFSPTPLKMTFSASALTFTYEPTNVVFPIYYINSWCAV